MSRKMNQCKYKIGKTYCNKKYYSSGYCKEHYLSEFNKNKKKFGEWQVRGNFIVIKK